MEKPNAEKTLTDTLQYYIDHLDWKPKTPTPDDLIDGDMKSLVHVAMTSYGEQYHAYMEYEQQRQAGIYNAARNDNY